MRQIKYRSCAIFAFALFACTTEQAPVVPESVPAGDGTGGEFELEIDPQKGTITMISDGFGTTTRGGVATGFPGPLVAVQDGVSGSNPPNTLELETLSTATDATGAGACGEPSSFCANVRVRSFYGQQLRLVFVQLVRITPATGHAALNSDSAQFGLSDAVGLWNHGTLAANGGFGDRLWVFQDDGTPFRVKGRIFGEMFIDNWEISVNGGPFGSPTTLPDTGWGCDGCFREYRASVPFHPRTIRFRWSSDNQARLFVNGAIAFDAFFIPGYCTDQPCCGRCCDTPGNCFAGLSDPRTAAVDFNHPVTYNAASNEFIWRVDEEFGGDGFYVEMSVSP